MSDYAVLKCFLDRNSAVQYEIQNIAVLKVFFRKGGSSLFRVQVFTFKINLFDSTLVSKRRISIF